jgi:hypothetical protein
MGGIRANFTDMRVLVVILALLCAPHAIALEAPRPQCSEAQSFSLPFGEHASARDVWSAQEFVDTRLGALRVGLKYFRTDAAEMAVPPDGIVE